MKWQLEDTAFAVLYPPRYAEIEQMVALQAPEREEFLQTVLAELRVRLNELRIDAEVTGRPKHYWSIYEKMITRGKQFDDVQDLVGVRVVVESVKDCYAALGSIHAMWKPVQGRFKDYIAMPKFNLYQSLHTTVVGPSGKAVEVQIRTQEMHRRAEFGIAAHWGYKESGPSDDLLWLQRMVDWQQEADDPGEFMETLKIDLEYDEVFVFTPKGKVIALAVGATPVDFVYAIHTDVGHRCIGARVNGRLVPLDSALVSGDTVEIFTSKVEGAGPSRDWLQFVRTPKARTKIRQWFSRERRVDAIDTGREELAKALRREGLPVEKLAHSDALRGSPTRSTTRTSTCSTRRSASTASRRRPWCSVCSASSEAVRSSSRSPSPVRPSASAGRPAGRRECTWRVSTTSWSGCRVAARPCPGTRSWGSSPGAGECRCTAPTARTRRVW